MEQKFCRVAKYAVTNRLAIARYLLAAVGAKVNCKLIAIDFH